jgi:hypothetical protein
MMTRTTLEIEVEVLLAELKAEQGSALAADPPVLMGEAPPDARGFTLGRGAPEIWNPLVLHRR